MSTSTFDGYRSSARPAISIADNAICSPKGTTLSDLLVKICVLSAPCLTVAIFAWMAFDLLASGLGEISWSYFFDTPKLSGRAGGIAPIIVSTILVVSLAVLIALPFSLASALFVTEFLPRGSRISRIFRASMLILAGIPSIAFGLFGSTVFSQYFGLGTSILSGSLTLAVMIIPTCAFASEEVLRLNPIGHRHGAYALGASRAQVIVGIILPSSTQGLAGAALLGAGRALAETAALIFTSGYSDRMPESILDPGRVLSLHIYDLAMNIPGGEARASAAAIVLMMMFFLVCFGVSIISSVVGKR